MIAWRIGAAAIAVAFAVGACHEREAPAPGKFQLVADSKGGVWKVNTITGEVWLCRWATDGDVGCFVQGFVAPR